MLTPEQTFRNAMAWLGTRIFTEQYDDERAKNEFADILAQYRAGTVTVSRAWSEQKED